MTENQANKLMKRLQENRKSLNIARVPDKTKEDFVDLANEKFCGDYGMALREILNCYLEYHAMKTTFFQNIDMKLDHILGSISQTEQKEEKLENFIRMLDGTKRVKGGVKNG